jgi:hypothetical protein
MALTVTLSAGEAPYRLLNAATSSSGLREDTNQ